MLLFQIIFLLVCVSSPYVHSFSFPAPAPVHRKAAIVLRSTPLDILQGGGLPVSTFANLLKKVPEILEKLDSKEPITIFAPTDESFKKLPADIIKKLGDWRNLDVVEKIVKFHVSAGLFTEEELSKLGELPNEGSVPLKITPATSGGFFGVGGQADGFRINQAKITSTEVCEHCIIHIVDDLLNPYLLYRFLVS